MSGLREHCLCKVPGTPWLQGADVILQQHKDAGVGAQPQDVLLAQRLELALRAAHEEAIMTQQHAPEACIARMLSMPACKASLPCCMLR